MKPKTLLWFASSLATCAALAACASSIPPTSDEAEQLAQAHKLLASAPDQAADTAELLLKQNPQLREARILYGESSLAMARSPSFPSGTESFLLDAENYLSDALGDVENEPYARELRLLAETHYELKQWGPGSIAAQRSADGFAQRPGLDNRKEYSLSRLVGARCDYRMFVESRRQETDNGKADMNGIVPPEARTLALASIAAAGYAEARLDHPSEATNQIAAIKLWLGQTAEAIKEYEAGLQEYPQEAAIHDAFIDWMCRNNQHDALVGAYRRFANAKPDTPILVSYQAIAIYARADRLRKEGNFQGAITIYQKARDTFAEFLAMMPQDRDNTEQWQALCDLSMARCAADTGDLEVAEQCLFRAGETSAFATQYGVDDQPVLVDTYGNHFTGAVYAIHMALTQSPVKALERTLAFNDKLCQRYPARWGFAHNNAALAARDLGVKVSKSGDEAAAMALWERSYKHYESAVALSPNDARITNDCGLMLSYHLHRDLDHARELFDRAIALGTDQLAQLPADAGERERLLLEEAVGDAWQNIAVMLRDHQKAPFEDYRRFCEESVKYYPYQRREAAALLRSNGLQALSSTLRAEANGSSSGASARGTSNRPQSGAAEALKKVRPTVEKHAENQDYDSALDALDKLAKDCKDHAPFHLLRGKMNWLLANQGRDNGRKGTELFYQDAVRAFERAVELDPEPVEPRQLLAQAQYDANEPLKATETLSTLLLHMQSNGGGTEEQSSAAHSLRANAAARAFAAAKSAGEADPSLLTAARTSMRWLEQKDLLDLNLLKLWSTTEQWADAPAEATNVFVRASERAPTDFGLLELVVSTAAEQKQLPLAIASLQKRDDAGTVWYLGKAQFWLAGEQRQGGKPEEAMKTLAESRASFEKSMKSNAGYKNTCEQWIAMCVGKQGNIAYMLKDYDKAEQMLIEATTIRPDMINQDLGATETTKRGILFLTDHFRQKNDLKRCESISRAVSNAASSDVDLLNNAGLFARDYGNIIERAGQTEAAQEMYEQSYKAYSRAVQVDGANVRLRNDCALIAIYHLDRDWDETKALLDGAIRDGERTLADSPPDDADEQQRLEEAVGDSYENLALWHLKHSKDGEAAKAAAIKSQDYYPGKRRPGARTHLRAAERLLQGK